MLLEELDGPRRASMLARRGADDLDAPWRLEVGREVERGLAAELHDRAPMHCSVR
jgi:hypothetical protein